MIDKVYKLKTNLEVFLDDFHSDIRLGNSLDDINLEDLCEFAEQLDVYLDLRIAFEQTGSNIIH